MDIPQQKLTLSTHKCASWVFGCVGWWLSRW